MQEVQYSDLKVGETYYIELLGPFTEFLGPLIAQLSPDFKRKRKGVVHIKDVEIDELSGAQTPWVLFTQFTDLNTTEIAKLSLLIEFDGRNNTKFYLPQRDQILERKEKEMVNTVCSHLAGDPTFMFY